ncbi:MAG: SusC/RagA family TonB-linked outer membrane protein [Gemmatimonadaceae bacterium]|nr:SusC/RagA family TonB-linked outer membrane protein [Gemmatimonadaceae bacterium]
MRTLRHYVAVVSSAGWLATAIVPAALAQQVQTRTITGIVTDQVGGEALPNAQVRVVGTMIAAGVRPDGRFTISVPMRAVTLQIRSLGYKPLPITVPLDQTTVRAALERDNFRLEEVVVSGQATAMERKNLATAVGTVSEEELARVPTSSVDRALEGKVTGAHVSENSGAPGGGSIVRIRGVTTIIGAFTPLYVVDGVVVSDVQLATGTNFLTEAVRGQLAPRVDNQDNGANRIADLNSYDIEKVEVLKGAAAAAIYGSKASNGVILITTKRGRAGSVQFGLTQRLGMSKLSRKYGLRCFTSADEAVSVFGEAARASWTPSCDNDMEEQLYGKTAGAYETSVNMHGGSEATRFFASALNKHDGGIMPGTSADKRSIRVNVDQNVGSRVTLSLNTEYVQTGRKPGVTQNENNGLSIPSAIGYGGASWLDLRQRADGTFPRSPIISNNPFQTAALFVNDETVNRGIVSARAQAQLWKTERQALRLSVVGGGDVFTQKNQVLAPPELYALEGVGLPGTSVLGYAQNTNRNVNAYLVHDFTLPGGTSTAQVGTQSEWVDIDASYTLTQGLIGGLTNIDRGLAVRVDQNRQRVQDQGFFAQEELLLFNERLLLTGGLRADRTTNNSNSQQLFYYPKASVSYRLPRLPDAISELKLRFAVGQSGNQPRYGQKFTELSASNLGGAVPTAQINGPAAAPDLRPERQLEIETGFDATMLRDRLNLEATVYEKSISDLLQQRTLAPGTGFTQLTFNGGSLRTRGVELAANAVLIEGRDFNWRFRAAVSGSRCTITALDVPAYGSTAFLNGNTFGRIFTEVGKSCTQITGNDTTADGKKVGNMPLGDANPDYNWSWSHDVGYKRFHLTGMLDGQKGGQIMNLTQILYDLTGISPDQITPLKPGELTGNQRAATFGRTARTYIQDISFVKLRELSLSYDVPAALLKSMFSQSSAARLSVSGRNLMTWTKYRSTGDPEVNQVSRSAAGGVPWDLWSYPPSRTYWLSVDLSF